MDHYKPKVSIVLLIYMVEEYLNKCIESAINQTYDNIEIILAVKRGEDRSFDICQEYAQKYENVVLVDRQGKSRGQGRNEGMDAVTGEYVLFVDGDDWMEPTMIERLVDSITKHNSDVVVCGDIYENEVDQSKSVSHIAKLPEVFGREEFYKEILSRSSFGVEVWNKLYRISKVEDIKFGEEQAEDRFWSAKAFERLDTISYVASPEFHYVIRGDSGSRKPHVMESSMQADCILVDNIKLHGYLQKEASYFLFISCYSAVYAALHFGYFEYNSWKDTYQRMRSLCRDVMKYSKARRQDKIKALFTSLGFHPLIWFARFSMKVSPAGIYDENEEK